MRKKTTQPITQTNNTPRKPNATYGMPAAKKMMGKKTVDTMSITI